jgi:YD repeat-containing protein
MVAAITLTDCSKIDQVPALCYLTSRTEEALYTETLAYNDRHQVVSVTVTHGTFPVATTFTYESNGNLQTVTSTDGSIWTFTFDSNNR